MLRSRGGVGDHGSDRRPRRTNHCHCRRCLRPTYAARCRQFCREQGPRWQHLRSEQVVPIAFAQWLRPSRDRDNIRVRFSGQHGRVYVGELTCYHESGMTRFEPDKMDLCSVNGGRLDVHS